MRAVRLIGLWFLVVVVGGVGAGVVSAWVVSRGGASSPAAVARTQPPAGPGSDPVTTLQAAIEVLGAGSTDLRVVVTNPNTRSVSGIRVTPAAQGGECDWVDGPFPIPLGLAPGASTARTCRLVPDAVATSGRPAALTVTVDHAGHQVARAAIEVAPPAPPPAVASSTPAPLPGTTTGPTASPGGGPTANPSPPPAGPGPPCPRLIDGLELGAAPLLDTLGPAVTDRARLLDVVACPEWAAVSGLQAVRAGSGPPCPAWNLHLDLRAGPVARLSGRQGDGCVALPLQVEVAGSASGRAAMVATLVAWAVEGSGTRAPELLHGLATGAGLGCDGPGSVAVGQAYEQDTGPSRLYRVSLTRC